MPSDLDTRIQETGTSLYNLIQGESPSVFEKEYWIGKMLDWCMQDEAFKIRMFRFIDVLPYLKHEESISRHLKEYFSGPELSFPSALHWGIKFLPSGSISNKLIARTLTNNIQNIGKQFIAGGNPQASIKNLEKLRSEGIAFTVDLLGEAVISEAEAEEYLTRYLGLFDFLNEAQKAWPPLGDTHNSHDWGHSCKVNVSLKTTAMYSQMNACAFDHSIAMAKERLRPIFRKAIHSGAFVSFDMEQYNLKNLTLALYRSLMEEPEFREYPHTGIVIQAYLHDSQSDLMDIIEWAQRQHSHFTIRLVKGAYWDSEVVWARQNNWPLPVFTNKHETDANFEKLAGIILKHNEWITLACASHNIRSISSVIEQAKALNVPRDRLEYQVLYGMGEPVRNALRKAGLPLRVYTPIGEMIQGMSYLVRRLLENTANESFLRKSFSEGISQKELLENPLHYLKQQRPGPASAGSSSASGIGPFFNEPIINWTHAENRSHFNESLERVRRSFPIMVSPAIGGKKITSDKSTHSNNPNAPEEDVGIISSAGQLEAEKAICIAADAFPAWRDTHPAERAQYLFKGATGARKMRMDFAALEVLEVGKTWSDADADVCEAIDYMEFYAREMLRLARQRRMGDAPGEDSHLFYEPRGVSVVIAPWNFPMAIAMGMTAAALVTGNTVIFKPASQSPVVGSMIYKVFEEAKLPAGVLNFLPGAGNEIGDYLVTHPKVTLIAFTGSKEVGLRILELANMSSQKAHHIKNVIAEMGGKNAIIVDADADLDEAVTHILRSAFGYQGQKCSACSRLIVLEENYERLLQRLKAAAESLNLGPTEDPKNFMGALIEPAAKKKVTQYIEIGKTEGNLLLEHGTYAAGGHFVPLTIFTDIQTHDRIAQEEIFGPLLAIIKVKDFEEAIEAANSTEYALTGSVFSRSPGNIAKAKREFRTGNLYVNRGCTGAIVGRHPFGGFKMSGIGSKAGGPDYLLQFMVPRNVVENTLRRGFAPVERGEA